MKHYKLILLALVVAAYWVWAFTIMADCWDRGGEVVQGMSFRTGGWICIGAQ